MTSGRVRIETDDRELYELLSLWLSDGGYELSDGKCELRIVDTETKTCDGDTDAIYIVSDKDEDSVPEYVNTLERPFGRLTFTEKVRASLSTPSANVRLDDERRRVYHKKAYVYLTEKEYAVFRMLYENIGKIVPREEIAAVARGGGQETNAADVYICMLRRKLTELFGGSPIKTVRGKGYVLSLK